MHEAVTGAAQPGDVLQLVLWVPGALEHLGVHAARDQVVVGQRDPGALADLAGVRGGAGLRWRRGCGGERRDERLQRREEELRRRLLRAEQAVSRERVGDVDGEGVEEPGGRGGRQRVGVLRLQRGRVQPEGVGEGPQGGGKGGEYLGGYVLCIY